MRPRSGTATKKKSAGKKGKKGAEDEKEKEEDDDEELVARVKREQEEDKDEEMDDHTARSDDKSKADSVSTASTSPPPKNNATTLSLATTGSASAALFGSEALVGVDERELSSTFLRVLQSDQVSVQSLLKQASMRKSIPPMAFQALISYIANALHPDDFAAFLKSFDTSDPNSKKAIEGLAVDRLHVRLPDGRLMPRVLFTFRKSSLDALPDSERGVDMAMIYVYRVPNVQGRPAAAAEQSISGADKAKAADDESDEKKQKEEAGSTPPSHSATSSAPATPASPNPCTPAGLQSVKSTDSDSNDPTSPGSASTSSSSSTSASAAASPVCVTPADASSPPTAGTTPLSSSSASLSHLSSSDAYPPFVPAPVPGANFDSLSEVDLAIQVNREFERLFGYSQREMKDLMMREQAKGLYRLYTPQSLLQLGRWLTEACTGVKTEFKAIVTIVNKWRGQTNCVLSARFILDPLGFFSSVCYAYTPLPENTSIVVSK